MIRTFDLMGVTYDVYQRDGYDIKRHGAKWNPERKMWQVRGEEQSILQYFAKWDPVPVDFKPSEEDRPNVYVKPDKEFHINREFFNLPEKVLFLDTETTGTSGMDEVVELGIVDETGAEVYHSLFHPTRPMDARASHVNGFTDETLKDAPLFKTEYPKIASVLQYPVVAYNLPFDRRMIIQTAMRYKIPRNNVSDLFIGAIDFMPIVTDLSGKRISLAEAARRADIDGEEKHRASYDALMILEVLDALSTTIDKGGDPYKIMGAY